ncbi:MAG: CDP-diacylglycerol--serine O-phosphatidyltransferase [Verrucomicrobiales bacterium]|nr:CDP-diacylglycerol--serine O-phosphatidyltransferase [Verrucomicrobiales bacterium]
MKEEEEYEPKIYLLPNLMTAGNLVCGFLAIISIINAISNDGVDNLDESRYLFERAIWLILAGCLFDVLDGRLARLGGQDSPFGKEFDSIADIVSFGVAPALLVQSVIMNELSGSFPFPIIVASIYLVCGGMRLARFNCIATYGEESRGHFKGFPIPAAAGLISALTLFVLWVAESEKDLSRLRIVFLLLMLFLSYLMISSIKYPSFKKVTWKTQRPLPWVVGAIIVLMFTIYYYQWMPALLLVIYALYGLIRPFIPKILRKEIEDEILSPEEDDSDLEGESGVDNK